MKRIIRSKYPSGDIAVLLKGPLKKRIKGEMNQNSNANSVSFFHFSDFLTQKEINYLQTAGKALNKFKNFKDKELY